jgi:hypothetical protein
MKRTTLVMMGLGGLLVLLSGPGLLGCCGSHTEQDYGRSVANNLAAQVVHPEAGQKVEVGPGQAPDAAANAYEKYTKSFKPEEKKPVLRLTTEK